MKIKQLLGMMALDANANEVGKIDDAEFDPVEGQITAITIVLKKNFISSNKIEIDFEDVKSIGDYVLLDKEINKEAAIEEAEKAKDAKEEVEEVEAEIVEDEAEAEEEAEEAAEVKNTNVVAIKLDNGKVITGVDRALFGYIKSPINNRKTDDKYGVPITYGCDSTIAEIKETMKQLYREYKLKEAFVGADSTMFNGKDSLPLNGLFKKVDAGDDNFFEVFDPAFRPFTERLQELFKRLEHEIGTSAGILSEVNTANATANTYQIAYNANTGSGTAMSNSSHTYDASKALTKNTFTKTGYTFLGWNTNKDATTATYQDEITEYTDKNITGYTTMKKAELVAALEK